MGRRDDVDLGELESWFDRALDRDAAGRRELLDRLEAENQELAAALRDLLAANDSPDERLETTHAMHGPVFDAIAAGRDTPEDERVGPFLLRGVLGEGGMATVHRGVRSIEDAEQEVAVKVLKGKRLTQEGLARFARERRIVASLDHPGIARLIDGGVTDEGRPWVALELVDGRAIDRFCDEEALSIEQRVKLVIDVGRALQYAHQNLVVHRDLKPSNVLVDGSARVRLLDFGIAKELGDDSSATVTRGDALPMTPLYASPEQLAHEQITTASDQYQLGLLLFELLTGQCHHLLDGDDPRSILERASDLDSPRPSQVLESRSTVTGRRSEETLERIAQLRQTTLRELVLDVRGDLDWIVLKALSKNPADRYATVSDLTGDLERLLEGRPIAARPPSIGYRARKWVGRHRTQTALGVALALAVVGFSLVSAVQSRRADRVREFSLQVERETEQIERLLQDAALQPLHDMSPERQEVEARIATIEARADESPALLGPAAAYGVGRGRLALGDPQAAVDALEVAWNGGFRGDGIRYALGVGLGELYQRRLQRIQGIEDEALRSERLREVQAEFRDPALDHLAAVRDDERAGLRTALIAFYEGELDTALARVQEVRRESPWLYEAMAIEVDILRDRSEGRAERGDVEGARQDLEQAEAVLGAALDIGRSDAGLHLRQCELAAVRLRASTPANTQIPGLIASLRSSCDRAALIRPDWADPYITLANLYIVWWDVVQLGDVAEVMDQMQAAAQAAIDRDPDLAEAHHRLGIARFMDGRRRSRSGYDPIPTLEGALASLERAIELDPGYPYSYNGVALVTNELAFWRIRQGEDPSVDLERGQQAARRVIEMVPTWHNGRLNLANNYVMEGTWQAFSGGDPVPPLRTALAELDRILEFQPGMARVHRLRALPQHLIVAVQLEMGLDPAEDFEALARDVEVVVNEISFDPLSKLSGSRLALLRAWADPSAPTVPEELATGRRYLEEGEELTPGSMFVGTLRIEIELLAARYALSRGASPEPALRRAHAAFAAVADPLRAEAMLGKANAAAHRVEAAYRMTRGLDPTENLAAGRAASSWASETNPLHWGAAAEGVALDMLAAMDTPESAEQLAQLRGQLQEIAARNPRARRTADELAAICDGLLDGTISRREALERILHLQGSYPHR